jgi:hypothetical protein
MNNSDPASDLSLPFERTSLNEETWIVCCLNSVLALNRVKNHDAEVAVVAAAAIAGVVAAGVPVAVAADLPHVR